MSAELLGCAPKSLASLTLVSPFILVEPIDVGRTVNDQYDYIDWWLYEATDDYTVWEADCTMKYCLKEPEALYDFITGTLKPVPVSSGESTSQQE